MTSNLVPLLRRLVSVEEKEVYSLLAKNFPSGRILLYCHPNTFFDPVEMGADKEACFLGEVTFAVLDRNKYGSLVFCVIPKKGRFADSVAQILKQQKVAFIQGDFPEDLDAVLSECRELIKNPPTPRKPSRSQITEGENWIRIRLAKKLAEHTDAMDRFGLSNETFQILHEVPLRKVISYAMPNARLMPVSDVVINKKREYLSRSRFDVLLTTDFPDAFPLMAAEFQGPHHEGMHKKSRDKLKADICRDAGLPLLIATYQDVPGTVKHAVPKLALKTKFFRDCFEFAILTLLTARTAEIQANSEHSAHVGRALSRVPRLIESVESKQGVSLTNDEKLDLIYEQFRLDEPDLLSTEEQITLYSRNDDEEEQRFRGKLVERGVVLSPIRYSDNEALGGISVSADLQLNKNSGEKINIESPRISLEGHSFSQHSLKWICESFLRNWMLHEVDMRLECSSAQVISIDRKPN